ncbi:MAG: hypothetical protein ACFFBD_23625 [Candidatus Hodarchaeota archaeon]
MFSFQNLLQQMANIIGMTISGLAVGLGIITISNIITLSGILSLFIALIAFGVIFLAKLEKKLLVDLEAASSEIQTPQLIIQSAEPSKEPVEEIYLQIFPQCFLINARNPPVGKLYSTKRQ